jgi:uncharacterized protein YqgQ
VVYSCQRSGYFRSNELKGIRIIAIENQKVEVGKITCPKGILTKEEFLETVRVVNQKTKNRQQQGKPDRPV